MASWKSTKLWLAVFTMLLVTGAYAFTGFNPTLFGEYCLALAGAAGIYSSANVLASRKVD